MTVREANELLVPPLKFADSRQIEAVNFLAGYAAAMEVLEECKRIHPPCEEEECDGTGTRECQTCSGTGELACEACDGSKTNCHCLDGFSKEILNELPK